MKSGIQRLLLAVAVVLVAAFAWLAWTAIDSQYRERVKNALRRMDVKLDVILAPERRRPVTDYVSYGYLTGDVYTRSRQKLKQNQVIIESPLLTSTPQHSRIHFQISENGLLSSPQVPTGNDREIATDLEKKVTEVQLAANAEQLGQVSTWFTPEATLPAFPKLAGMWQDNELFFLRTADDKLQGFWADWPGLRKTLLAEIDDLFPDATLEPGEDPDRRLIAVPAVLHAPRPWTVFHATFLLVAVLILASVAMVGWQLRKRIEDQRRFASHVTHELRGPLTTFRLYHELLDEGLVDETKRKEYYATLRSESDRMAHLVENVIALSRLEAGRAKLHIEAHSVADLMHAAEPILRRLVPDITVTTDSDATTKVDREAVNQILVNLVGNAKKYGEAPIEVIATDHAIAVTDAGGGPGAHPFKPYERGRHEGTATRGLGVGLPLSRMLAREMGGDLTLERPARFVLRLPS